MKKKLTNIIEWFKNSEARKRSTFSHPNGSAMSIREAKLNGLSIVICQNDIDEAVAHIKSIPRRDLQDPYLLKIIEKQGYLWWLSKFIPITMKKGDVMHVGNGVYAHMDSMGADIVGLDLSCIGMSLDERMQKNRLSDSQLSDRHFDLTQIFLTMRKSRTDKEKLAQVTPSSDVDMKRFLIKNRNKI